MGRVPSGFFVLLIGFSELRGVMGAAALAWLRFCYLPRCWPPVGT